MENADLAIDAGELAKGRLRDWDGGETHGIRCGTTTLEGLFSAGPTHDLIGHLQARDSALWAADCKTQKRLIVRPTHKGIEIRKELAQRMRAKKSKLLYTRNMSWTSQGLVSATTEDAVLGSGT